jgi:hypothetical protein
MEKLTTPQNSLAPLESCLLVDYRLSSRTEIKDRISSTQLYGAVHEPNSLKACLDMVRRQRVETCVFGPSVKSDVIQDFIDTAQMSEGSVKCAFVVFRAKDKQEEIRGAHSVVDFPCQQANFNAGLVRALVSANGGVLPVSQRIDVDTGRPVSVKERLLKLEYPAQVPWGGSDAGTTSDIWPRALIDVVMKQVPNLYDHLLRVHPFNLKFRTDGTPSEFTIGVIRDVIEDTFPNCDDVPSMARFKDVLEPLLYRWVERGTLEGRAAANFVLQRDIRRCLHSMPSGRAGAEA